MVLYMCIRVCVSSGARIGFQSTSSFFFFLLSSLWKGDAVSSCSGVINRGVSTTTTATTTTTTTMMMMMMTIGGPGCIWSWSRPRAFRTNGSILKTVMAMPEGNVHAGSYKMREQERRTVPSTSTGPEIRVHQQMGSTASTKKRKLQRNNNMSMWVSSPMFTKYTAQVSTGRQGCMYCILFICVLTRRRDTIKVGI